MSVGQCNVERVMVSSGGGGCRVSLWGCAVARSPLGLMHCVAEASLSLSLRPGVCVCVCLWGGEKRCSAVINNVKLIVPKN